MPNNASGSFHAIARPPVRDFRDLARRISTQTTNLLAIGILTGGALAVTGRLTEWWRTDPAAPQVASSGLPPVPWDDPAGMVLEFGNQPWSIHRQTLSDRAEDALHTLLEQCRGILNESASIAALPAIDTSERTLLARLRESAPIEESPDGWRLYAIGGPLPWIVGIRASQHKPSDAQPDTAAMHESGPTDRLLCWGLALPQPDGRWTLYVMERRTGDAAAATPDLPLPAGTRRLLRISSVKGGEFTCFTIDAPATRFQRDCDASFRTAGWNRLGDWTGGRSAYTVTFIRESDPAPLRADITLTADAGRWTGVAVVMPEASGQ